jgi:serine phosphatase RsbU (regulator of sigma subunit)
VIVQYSDGITDHLNSAGTEFGKGRLATLVRSHYQATPAQIISAIFDDLDRFSTQAFDDQTLFVMKVL